MAQERRMKAEREQLQAQMALLRVEDDHAVVSGTAVDIFCLFFLSPPDVCTLYPVPPPT